MDIFEFFSGWITWGSVSLVLSLLPYAIYASEKISLQKNNHLYKILCFISLVFLILSGHPQTIFYCLAIYTLWNILRTRSAASLLIMLLALLFCAPALLPSIPIIASSIRNLDNSLSYVNFGFIPWSKILTLLMSPNFFGNPATGNYFGGDYNFQEKLVYFGVTPLLLSIYAVISAFRHRHFPPLLNIGILFVLMGLLISTQYPFGWIIYHFHFPLISTSPAGRGMVVAIFGSYLLSGIGLRELLRGVIDGSSFYISAIFVGSLFFFAYLCISSVLIIGEAQGISAFLSPTIKELTITSRNLIIPAAIFLTTLLIILLSILLPKLNHLPIMIIPVLILIDGLLFFYKYTPFVNQNLYFPDTPALNFIQNQSLSSKDIVRIERFDSELLPPNMWEQYHLQSTSGYDPLAPQTYERYLIEKGVHSGFSRYVDNSGKADLLDELGIKYLLVLKRDVSNHPSPDGTLPPAIDPKRWHQVFSEGSVSVLENTYYKQPYFLEINRGIPINMISFTDESYDFHLNSPSPDKLVLYVNYSPNWHAKVNGYPVEIKKFKNTFISVPLASGSSDISLKYQNPLVNMGYGVSVITIIMLLLFVFV